MGSDESESSFADDASESRESDGSPACVFGAQESATALGTAFHRLAQQAIERSERGSLFAPSETAIRAQIQKEGLSEEQQARLRAALVRWLGSDEAARFAAFENRRAEVPFTVAIGGFFLEGEIDGLADNGDGAAFLIDYKTGGRADETPKQLDEKHRLQASCCCLCAHARGLRVSGRPLPAHRARGRRQLARSANRSVPFRENRPACPGSAYNRQAT
ncbi:MAG: PD-(D/E)XK nuclease family protein [Adlercreutzia equolifaciens]